MISILALLLTLATAIDPSRFNNLAMYEIFVSSFQDGDPNVGYCIGWGPSKHCGDLRGIINAIDYISDLGINALWITPFFDSNGTTPTDSCGYFAYDYFNVDPRFGTNEDFKELVEKAHSKDIYVFLDGVFGHHKHSGVKESPNGLKPVGNPEPVSYPGSMEFYKEVAAHWIQNYEIDGWRLDAAYQLSIKHQDRNYWYDMREYIESICDEREKAGKKWGTLCYMVGEVWDGETNIMKWGYKAEDGKIGLRSMFHFPGRYRLVQTFAVEENGQGGWDAGNLAGMFNHGYPSFAVPALFVSNHDTLRFGNLIRMKYGYGKENSDYWGRHRAVFGFMAQWTGPIQFYYGDEIGDITECYYKGGDCNGAQKDNAGRTDGQITNLDANQKALYNFISKILNIRKNNSPMYQGKRQNQDASGTLYKVDKVDGTQKIQVLINTNNYSYTCYCGTGTDLITGNKFSGSCHMEAFSVKYIKM